METQQFEELCIKIDRIFAILAVQDIEDKNEKVYILKKLGVKSEEINLIVRVKNCRQMEGWKRE